MQTNAEAKRLALENLQQINTRLRELIAVLSAHPQIIHSIVGSWEAAIELRLKQYENYVNLQASEAELEKFNILFASLRSAFVPATTLDSRNIHAEVYSFIEIAAELVIQMPQGFLGLQLPDEESPT